MTAFLDKIWNKFWICFENSIIGKLSISIGHFFARAFSGSLFFSALSGEKVLSAGKNSIAGKILLGIFKWLSRFSDTVGQRMAKGSVILSAFCEFFNSLVDIGLPHLGSLLLPIGIYTITINIPLGIIVSLISAVLIFIPVSLKGILQGSGFVKLFFGEISFNLPETQKGIKWGYLIGGAIFGILAYVLSPFYAVLIFGGIIGGAAVLWRPEIGVFACVALAPFLPTMLVAVMLLGTFMCFLLSLLFGGKRVSFKLDTTGVFIAVYAVILLFYGATSYTPETSIKIALLECLFIMGYFLITSLMRSEKLIKGLVFTYCTAALFTGIIGFYQYLSGQVDMTWVDKELFEGLSFRVYSTFDNPNVYGEYLLLALPMSAAMALISKRWTGKIYYAGISAVLLANLALTYSRGCYLAILLAVGIFICFVARRLIAVGVAGLFALPFVLPASIITRFTSITNLADTSTSYRINIWQGTIRMLEDFWWLGIGLGQESFNSVYPRYSLNGIVAPHSHSLFLQLMTETGIVGFIIFAAIIFCFINACINGFKKSEKKTRIFIAAMISAVLAFIFEGFFEHIFYNFRVFLMFFITLGLVCAVCNRVTEKKEEHT